jgi:isocitrate dehydrogenase kinase/phosphatase
MHGDGAVTHASTSGLAQRGAELVWRGFERYRRDFLAITRRAKRRFEQQDWHAGQADAQERLGLYDRVIGEVVAEVRTLLGPFQRETAVWAGMREAHSQALLEQPAAEIAETFFNSVTRRIFHTVGINPAIEYLDFRFERVAASPDAARCREYAARPDAEAAVRALLGDYSFAVPWADLGRDARLVAREIERSWAAGAAPLACSRIEVLEPVFYRRKGAYLVGRARGGDRVMPLVLALVHEPGGVVVDAVLHTESEVSIVFGFTRSYFQAEVQRPAETIAFLRSLMPVKPVGELYNALGFHKHGKTEFYRALQRHLVRTTEQFERAPGSRGLVMEVFTLPSFDVVFKVIRDEFPLPKRTTPDEVKRRYELVFAHDRAGRLVEAQLFEGLSFPRERFGRRLLTELLDSASCSVHVAGDQVVLGHVYAERRVRPLDLYLRESETGAAVRAALDYGQAIRDLASTGIFPGDVLLKNFGVTRHGRVVFYDYDELRLLDECRFRDLPEPRYPEEELADEPWFHVAPNDVFPEELARFVPFDGERRDAFLAAHGRLYTLEFWRDLQARSAAGEVGDIFPYGEERRLRLSARHDAG